MREYKKTVLMSGLVAIFTAPKHGGFMLFLVAPLFVIWVVYSILVIRSNSEQRTLLFWKIAIWVVVLASLGGIHWYYATASRQDAERVASSLFRYKAQQGVFPVELSQVGIDAQSLKKDWMLHYSIVNGQPVLFYATTFTPFETYSYDFAKRAWHHNPD